VKKWSNQINALKPYKKSPASPLFNFSYIIEGNKKRRFITLKNSTYLIGAARLFLKRNNSSWHSTSVRNEHSHVVARIQKARGNIFSPFSRMSEVKVLLSKEKSQEFRFPKRILPAVLTQNRF